MSLQDFINRYNGHRIDFDGAYGAQCVDLVQFYNRDVVGGARLHGNAKDLFGEDAAKYTWVRNTPNGVPAPGSIMVWGPSFGGGFGHTGIVVSANVHGFTSFDQNFPYNYPCHLVNHNYAGVIGWGTPKTAAPPPPPPAGHSFIVRVDKPVAMVRSAAKSAAPLAGTQKLYRGQTFSAIAVVDGENVNGNSKWFKSALNHFVWSGGLTRI